VSPSVVQVVGRKDGGDLAGEESEGVQSGTGFVWDDAGNIVTNNHVVEGTTEVAVRLASGKAIPADIVGTAANYDLAVIRLRNLETVPKPIAIGSSADLKVGQFAFAIGNPFGLDQSLTFGVISALHRRLVCGVGHPGFVPFPAAVAPRSPWRCRSLECPVDAASSEATTGAAGAVAEAAGRAPGPRQGRTAQRFRSDKIECWQP
jgi:S1-C subfamily serine protease